MHDGLFHLLECRAKFFGGADGIFVNGDNAGTDVTIDRVL